MFNPENYVLVKRPAILKCSLVQDSKEMVLRVLLKIIPLHLLRKQTSQKTDRKAEMWVLSQDWAKVGDEERIVLTRVPRL